MANTGENFYEARARQQAKKKAFFASLSREDAFHELASCAADCVIDRIRGHFDERTDPGGRMRVLDEFLPRAVGKMVKWMQEAASVHGVECTREEAEEACRNMAGFVAATLLSDYCNGICGPDGLRLEQEVADPLCESVLPEGAPRAPDAVGHVLQLLGPVIVKELRAEIERPKPSGGMKLNHSTDPFTVKLVERIKARGREEVMHTEREEEEDPTSRDEGAPVAGSNKRGRSQEQEASQPKRAAK